MPKDTQDRKGRKAFLRGALVFFILFIIYIAVLIVFLILNYSSPQGVSVIIPGGMTLDLGPIIYRPHRCTDSGGILIYGNYSIFHPNR